MNIEPEDEVETCLDCGAVVSDGADRGFPIGNDDLICVHCALRRGGEYDEEEERWRVAPAVQDLEERVEE